MTNTTRTHRATAAIVAFDAQGNAHTVTRGQAVTVTAVKGEALHFTATTVLGREISGVSNNEDLA